MKGEYGLIGINQSAVLAKNVELGMGMTRNQIENVRMGLTLMTCKMRLAIELGSGLEPGLEVFYPGQATALLMSKMSKPLHRPYKFVLCGNRQVFISRRRSTT